ncbi:hypothetical protein P7K49_037861 [Saguinus oedipus]|uniref:Uncharacterized protein n=1 Tax=Saguinus oedipus TaxID=9490 RepID=A0ABQ9TJA1_SAGOE|nr:hypothetical protein P7K49_037861 [Saguinus oedipus]
MDIIGVSLRLGTMERGSTNGKTTSGAHSHSRGPGQTINSPIIYPGLGTGISLCLGLTIMKVVIPISCIQVELPKEAITNVIGPGYENSYQSYHSPALREEYAYGSYYYHGPPQRLQEERGTEKSPRSLWDLEMGQLV